MKSSTATATTATVEQLRYTGRFAPTPTGELHLGSLYAAAASYLDARAHGGRWLLRIEDLDCPREVAGCAARILQSLEAFGFEWDGEIVRQHERRAHYEAALRELDVRGLTFRCSCSRLNLSGESRYPGTCREQGTAAEAPGSIRLRVDPAQIQFTDRVQGTYRQDVSAAVGDIILKRRDGIFAYVLAVVLDDAAQGVTDIVRGADLLDNTPRQIYLQRLLGLPQPRYAHVPVLTEAHNGKLAKSRRSAAIRAGLALPQLLSVFSLLNLAPPVALREASLAEAWDWARREWHMNHVPRHLSLCLNS